MTDEEFETILAGVSIAHREKLHRLGSLLSAAAAAANDPTQFNLDNLSEWASLVAGDLVKHHKKMGSPTT